MILLPYLGQLLLVLFCVIISVQLFYYLFFFLRLAIYKKPAKQYSDEHPISVVICARDEAHNLVNNLPGVLVQDYNTTHEIILVNDNSEDESKYLLDEFKKSYPGNFSLRWKYDPIRGLMVLWPKFERPEEETFWKLKYSS